MAATNDSNATMEPNTEPGLEISSWQRVIFSLLLCTIHQVLNVVTSLILHLKYFWCSFSVLCPPFRSRPRTFEDIANECKTRLTKLPSHVAFAFLEAPHKICLNKVSDAVVWALASGANCVSLYDIGGHLKQKQIELLTEIRKTVAEYYDKEDDNESVFSRHFRLEWHPHQESESHVNGNSNGNGPSGLFQRSSGRNGGSKNGESSSSLRVIHLSLLSARDGRQDLVSVARNLASQANSGQLVRQFSPEKKISVKINIKFVIFDDRTKVKKSMLDSV